MPSELDAFSRAAAALVAVSLAGCAGYHARRVDRALESELGTRTERLLGAREESVLRPALAPALEEAAEGDAAQGAQGARGAPGTGEAPSADEAPVRTLSLADSLEVAVRGNREYKARLEDLELSALSLFDARHAFSPRLSAVLSYLYDNPEGAPTGDTQTAAVGVEQALPWGGTLGLDASSTRSDFGAGEDYSPLVSIRLAQPLLRGAGYEVSHASLIQAERSLVYEIRAFELFREDFAIDVARRYYDLVERGRNIANQRENMQEFTFSRRQAEALFQVGRAKELDVLRARREELNSENLLIAEEEGHQLELDRFRIFLGLPPEVRIEIEDVTPEFVPVDYDVGSAVEVALVNRLDVITSSDRIEDSARAVRIAENGLLPDLDLSLDVTLASDDVAADFGGQDLGSRSVLGGATLGLPVDRVNERNNLRAARIGFARSERGHEELVDQVAVQVKSDIREISRRRRSVEIQSEQIVAQEKNLRVAKLRFEQGDVNNRDVVEAQQSLLEAKNALISEQVGYEIARLQLLRNLGILFIDERGMWKE